MIEKLFKRKEVPVKVRLGNGSWLEGTLIKQITLFGVSTSSVRATYPSGEVYSIYLPSKYVEKIDKENEDE